MSRLKSSRDSQVKSGQSRLLRDSWRLFKGFLVVRGHAPLEKIEISGFQTAGNALKLTILPSPHYFSLILNLLRSDQADLFGSWGVCAPPPAYGPADAYRVLTSGFQLPQGFEQPFFKL